MPRPAILHSTTISIRAAHKKQYSRTGSLPGIETPDAGTQGFYRDRIGVNEILKKKSTSTIYETTTVLSQDGTEYFYLNGPDSSIVTPSQK